MPRTRLSKLALDDVNRAILALSDETTRVLEQLNQLRAGTLAFTGPIDLGGNRITNAGDSQNDSDVLTAGELLDQLDQLEEEAAQLETAGAEDYSGGGRQKRLQRRTSRLKDAVEDAANNIIAALGFPGVVFTQDDGAGNAELATDTVNFVWDDANNRLGIGIASPSTFLHVRGTSGGAVPALVTENIALFQRNAAVGEDCEIAVLAGTSARARLYLGNTTDYPNGGELEYDNTTQSAMWVANGTNILQITQDGVRVDAGQAFVSTTNTTLDVFGNPPTIPALNSVTLGLFAHNTNAIVAIVGATTGTTGVDFGDTAAISGRLLYVHTDDSFRLTTAGTEKVRLTSGGVLLVGTTTADAGELFEVGATQQFRVGTDGDLDRIKDVPYSWPAAQGAASTFLQNDGAGALSWVTAATAGLVSGTGVAGQVAYWSSTTAITSEAGAGANSFTWDAATNSLGIGTTTPSEELHVVGDAILTGTLYGGTAASDDLVMQSTSDSTRGFIELVDRMRTHTGNVSYTGGGQTNIIHAFVSGTTTLSGVSPTIRGFIADGSIVYATDPDAFGMCSFFNFFTTLTNTGNRAFSAARIFADTSTTTAAAGTTVTGASHSSFFASPQLAQAGTISATDWNMFHSVGRLTAGTLTNFRAFYAAAPTVITNPTNSIGLDIETLPAATLALSVRSSNTSAQMRHAGVAVFGANAAVTANTTLEVSASATSSFRNSTRTIFPPTANQVIDAAADTILANATFVNASNATGASITLTSAPTIADGEDGMYLIIMSVGANDIVVQDQGTLAGSNLRLGAATRTLGTRDNLVLIYSSDIGDWVEVSFNNVT